MARGYRQVEIGSYLYRQAGRGGGQEYRVERIVFDGDVPVKVQVREVRQGTVANPGLPQHPQVRFWSLDQIDADATAWRAGRPQGAGRVTDAWDRTVQRVSFDRMIADARKKKAGSAA